MGLQFGIFDHIEPVPGLTLGQIYSGRLQLLEQYDAAGFYAYHLAEHHTPAFHSLAPSQNVLLAAASQRTQRLRLAPCVYVLPLYHPLRLIEEVCMLDHLTDGRFEMGVGRGAVLEAQRRGLTQFLGDRVMQRPAGLPMREADPEQYRLRERSEAERRRRVNPGNVGERGRGAGVNVVVGTPDSVRSYMDEYMATGANYFVCSFQWGHISHEHAMRSIDLFVEHIMPHYQ